MDKAYNHHDHEDNIYKKWEDSGAFTPKKDTSKKTFTIIMPPPNANDPLHVGHAMFIAVEDILVRYHRMKGDATEWLPGTDHAGIETQFVFEKKLAKKDQSRFDFDRETLYKMIWDYVEENSGVAVSQMKKLGASADWSRFTFTLDPKVVDFVYDTFAKLNSDNLVYRQEKLVNYCVKCGTGYSELEIEYEEKKDPLYFVRYPLLDNTREFLVVATVRPEPIFADTHLAVNPNDKKNNKFIGKKVTNPLTGAVMEVIGDEFVDPAFGTGIVKLTPAHDSNDWAVAEKHNLPKMQAINMQGKLTEEAGPYAGLKVAEGRKQIVEYLKEKGLIEKIDENYTHRVATCYRDHSPIEPMPLPQFFIKVEPLTKMALKALDTKETVIHGAGREAILRTWLNNLRDWNVSRQIVWGIRIPVWYEAKSNPDINVLFVNKNKEKVRGRLGDLLETNSLEDIASGLQTLVAPKDAKFVVSKEKPGEGFIQETDTFDTWFSSGQWPVVTLKIRGDDFEYFYPTSVMETAYEILPFWVMRMMMLGIYLTGKSPFKDVYLHGLVRDAQGRKMSKSVGNVINPLDFVEKYGSDAIRMGLVMGSTPGQDKSVGEQTIKGMRNLSNKIWNATRFVVEFEGDTKDINDDLKLSVDKWIETMTKNLDNLKVGQAAEFIYSAFWHEFCDKWIEEAKKGLVSKEQMTSTIKTLLKLLHPFAPFVTEACWESFAKDKEDLLITSSWPSIN